MNECIKIWTRGQDECLSTKIFGYETKQINLDANFTVATAAPGTSSPCSHEAVRSSS